MPATLFRCFCLSILCLPMAVAADNRLEQQARSILAATGTDGGLVVHLGCGDGRLTAALKAGDGFLVHGLDVDAESVDAARRHIGQLGIYGSVSVDVLAGNRLPYAENMVNLLVAEDVGDVSREEIMRVLVPEGVAYLKQDGQWSTVVKPWPADMDQWTHFLHGPDNNAVSHDADVGPPRHIRWNGLPKFSRAHEQLASLSACVTAGGRMFYIVDETPRADIRLDSRWYLVARDAFNGVVLWKKPLDSWADQLRRFRSGPPHLPFRLVADDRRVFVTLGIRAPVTILDAATGRQRQTIAETDYAKQILHKDETLAVLTDVDMNRTQEIDAARRRGEYIQRQCQIKRFDLDSGKLAWEVTVDELVFPCMALDGQRLFYQTPTQLGCLDYSDGRTLWTTDFAMSLPIAANKARSGELQWETPTLVVHDDRVMVSDFQQVRAFAIADGKPVWSGDSSKGYNSPADVLVIDDLVWTKGKGARAGLDPKTGDLRQSFTPAKPYMHPRCYRSKATDRYLMLGEMGVQFVDVKTGEVWNNDWIRGTCQYGVMPANGLLYVTPDSCACNMKTKLAGLYALAAQRPRPVSAIPDQQRLQKGPAFGKHRSASHEAASTDWTTYRHDPRRSGITGARVPAQLTPRWQTDVGGKLTSPVMAGGTVLVASVDRHSVHALRAGDGQQVWSFVTGGRIDSPPTVYRGLVLFGSADGSLYAVRQSDGALAWKFTAAVEDRRCFSEGQLESVWPVHGSVLIDRGVLTVTAGRSSYLDGGIRVYQLNPETGDILNQRTIYSPDPETGKQPLDPDNRRDVHGVLSDVLVAEKDGIYMRHMKLDLQSGSEHETGVHLFSPIGLLDDTWWHRAYWTVNDQFTSHWSGWWKVGNSAPSGRILSCDDDFVFGFGRNEYHGGNTGQWRGGEFYRLFSLDRHGTIPAVAPKNRRDKGKAAVLQYHWTRRVPMLVKALVVTPETVFIAGPPDVVQSEESSGEGALRLSNPQAVLDAWQGKQGAMLWAVSRHDGSEQAAYELQSPPVFDGMAASEGSLYLSTADGRLVCFSGE